MVYIIYTNNYIQRWWEYIQSDIRIDHENECTKGKSQYRKDNDSRAICGDSIIFNLFSQKLLGLNIMWYAWLLWECCDGFRV